MLAIRLARSGRHKSPFYRIVLTEHTKPANAGYKEILGWFNPMSKEIEVDAEKAKGYIQKGAQPSSRVAKLIHSSSKDAFFADYYVKSDKIRKPKNEKGAE